MKDMEFAMAMATEPQSTDPFLGPLSIAQTVRDGVRRRGAREPGDEEVMDFVDGATRDLIVAHGAPLDVGAAVMPADEPQGPPKGAPSGPTVGGEEGGKPRGITMEPEVTGKACCIVTFQYPVKEPEFVKETSDQSGLPGYAFLGWIFEVLAIWKNTGVDPVTKRQCDCTCCEFRQIIEGDEQFIAFADEFQKAGSAGILHDVTDTDKKKAGDPIHKSGEDCKEVEDKTKPTGKRRVCFGDRDPALAYKSDQPPSSYEYYSSGTLSGAPPGVADLVNKALAEKGEKIESVCVYYMKDKPGMHTSGVGRFMKNMCFKGQVWNMCPAETLLREESFRLYMSGKIYEDRIQDVQVQEAGKDPKSQPVVKKPVLGVLHDRKPKSPQYVRDCKPPT